MKIRPEVVLLSTATVGLGALAGGGAGYVTAFGPGSIGMGLGLATGLLATKYAGQSAFALGKATSPAAAAGVGLLGVAAGVGNAVRVHNKHHPDTIYHEFYHHADN